ncbi:MAG: glycoside hydrolase family 13 protein [Eubacterium sp.]|nr:glycoside hydrolase family 13 protein [Eubacterium sp.]
MNFRYNSWDLRFKEPFGAIPAGSAVTIRVHSTNTENIRLRTFFDGQEQFYPMLPAGDPGMHTCTLTLPETPGILWYDFSFDYQGRTYRYGTHSDGFGGDGQIYEAYPPSYQITLYKETRKLPRWYTDGIMYQIFPDRFFRGSHPNFSPSYPKNSLMHGNWSDSPHYFRNDKGEIQYWDFFGGNLAGIIEKLDYLKSLRISILYLNPIFLSGSNHKYDTADYRRISPEFGDEALFKELCQEAKKRGISVILDGVFSHTGDDSVYFNKYGTFDSLGAAQSPESPYYPWYRFEHYPDDYECWWGVKSMPNVEEMNPDYQNFIYGDADSVIRHWIAAGASGWRLDVADELPDPFIAGIKAALLKEREDTVLIGEVWEDASRKIAYDKLREYFWGDELDAVMNYPFRQAFIDYFLGNKNSQETAQMMMSLYENYPRDAFRGSMNLIGSHDRRRILTVLGEAPELHTEAEKENFRLTEDKRSLAVKRLKLLSLIQMTFPGVPCIYYGDEAGLEGYEDPYNRGAYPWGNEDHELLAWYKKITALRADHLAFARGLWYPLKSQDDVFAYIREYKKISCLCLFNRHSQKTYTFEHPSLAGKTATDLLKNESFTIGSIDIAPLSAMILRINEPVERIWP